MLSKVALIPARGGSKRLPRKNIVDFLGRPILAYTIEAALESGCFASTVVSTEDDEIAAAALRAGASVDRRSPGLATDAVGLKDVCIDFLDRERTTGREWDVLACLYATAPMRTADDIRATVALVDCEHCHFSMAVTTYDQYPHQALKLGPGGSLEPMWPELVALRGTELPLLRAGNGSTYVVGTAEFRRLETFYGPNLRGHEMPRERSIDIDTRDDLEFALWTARRIGFGPRF